MTDGDGAHAELVAALRAQDPAVAVRLWQLFAPSTSRVLRRTLGPTARIDDAVQVVLLCVFHRGARVRPRTDVSQLVLKVIARVAQAELRRARAARDSARSEDEALTQFYRILNRLSAADRIAFVFHHVENIEVRTVAAALGATVAETKRRLRRALETVFAGIQRDPVLRG